MVTPSNRSFAGSEYSLVVPSGCTHGQVRLPKNAGFAARYSEFGNVWFARREAGDLLRELWSLGQGPTADELLKDVTGATLEMASVAERIREGIS